jgi:hypothetical protein
MGTIDLQLARELRDQLGLKRAVETGTYRGVTARALSRVFDSVVTIELARPLYERAVTSLRDLPNLEAVHGHSAEVLGSLAGADTPTLYFLDGHWSGGATEGTGDECPLLDELAAIGAGNVDDCLVIDDARLFTSAPPPPHNPAQWPQIVEVFDAIRAHRPQHTVTLLSDQVLAVPQRATLVLDAYGSRVNEAAVGLPSRVLSGLLHPGARVRSAGRN